MSDDYEVCVICKGIFHKDDDIMPINQTYDDGKLNYNYNINICECYICVNCVEKYNYKTNGKLNLNKFYTHEDNEKYYMCEHCNNIEILNGLLGELSRINNDVGLFRKVLKILQQITKCYEKEYGV